MGGTGRFGDAVRPLVTVNEMNVKNTIESTRLKESEISVVAYQLWEKAGRPAGRDLQFWLAAEAQLRTATQAASAKPRSAFITGGIGQ